MNFIIAGRDTTAQLLGWFMYEMTKTDGKSDDKVNLLVEEKIRKEIETVLAKNETTDNKFVFTVFIVIAIVMLRFELIGFVCVYMCMIDIVALHMNQ